MEKKDKVPQVCVFCAVVWFSAAPLGSLPPERNFCLNFEVNAVCFLFFFVESLSFNDLFSQLLLKIRRVKFLDCTNLPNKGES